MWLTNLISHKKYRCLVSAHYHYHCHYSYCWFVSWDHCKLSTRTTCTKGEIGRTGLWEGNKQTRVNFDVTDKSKFISYKKYRCLISVHYHGHRHYIHFWFVNPDYYKLSTRTRTSFTKSKTRRTGLRDLCECTQNKHCMVITETAMFTLCTNHTFTLCTNHTLSDHSTRWKHCAQEGRVMGKTRVHKKAWWQAMHNTALKATSSCTTQPSQVMQAENKQNKIKMACTKKKKDEKTENSKYSNKGVQKWTAQSNHAKQKTNKIKVQCLNHSAMPQSCV